MDIAQIVAALGGLMTGAAALVGVIVTSLKAARRVEDIQASVDRVQSDVNGHGGNDTCLASRATRISERLDGLKAQLDRIEADL